MNLQLSYVRGANNTITVCDKNCIYLGSIVLNHFGMVSFDKYCALSIVELQEIRMVCQRLQGVI